MQLTPIERALRENVTARIESLVQQTLPNTIFKLFGSSTSGLNLPNSDIDIKVLEHGNQSSLRLMAEKIRDSNSAAENSILVIDAARIPIIRYIDRESKIKIDLPFPSSDPKLRFDELLRKYRREYPVFAKIVIVMKQFLRQRDLNTKLTGETINQ